MSDVCPPCDCMMIKIQDGHWYKPEYALEKKKITQEQFNDLSLDKDGYLIPNPNCDKCKGVGRKPIRIEFGESAKEQYVGVCLICGECNGIAFEYEKEDLTIESYRKPVCVNENCSNRGNEIDWINIKEM